VVLEVKLGELDENDQVAAAPRGSKPSTPLPSAPSVDALGMQLSQLTPELREKFEVSEKTKGVLVTKVEDGSTAAERGIRAGDVIVEVAQEEVTAPAQVAKKVTEANTQGRRSVLVMVERQGEQRFVGLPVDNKK
jgi:serine protease Do